MEKTDNNGPLNPKFADVGGTCAEDGSLTLASPARAVDTTDNTHLATVSFVGAIPQTAAFPE